MPRSSRFLFAVLTVTAAAFLGAASAPAAERANHVVIVVWDGLRPDLISETSTPNLWKLEREGVVFSRHHPVYPSSTEVNGTAIVTGCYPGHSGLIGNKEYRPEVDPLAPVGTESLDALRKGEKPLAVSTLPELLQRSGVPTAVAGTKPVALLADRASEEERKDSPAAAASVVLFGGKAIPAAVLPPIAKALGPFPEKVTWPNTAQDGWTTDALIDHLWKEGVPQFSLLWLSEPDYSQHHYGPGTYYALQALRSSDQNLGRLLTALAARGVREKTDVFVVSDHGFSTLGAVDDVAAILSKNGFRAFRRFPGAPERGDILVVGNGGSVLFYVVGRIPETTARLVSFLQETDFAGVILSRDPLPGTFLLSQLRIDDARAPDVVLSLRWTSEVNTAGVPGRITGDIGLAPGQGMHATLSRFDMHNTLVVAGPDFRRGWTDEVPSGNVDLAPTIVAILGLQPEEKMDGRVLAEAFREPPSGGDPLPPKVETERLQATAPSGQGAWTQYLIVRKVGETVYFDEGNGAAGR